MKNILTLAFLFMVANVSAQLKLPAVFNSNMVLQQQKSNNIWGWAKAGNAVTVQFKGKKYTTQCGANGKWNLLLDAAKAGNAGDIRIQSGGESITLKNIAVGEVWICSGQSNMEWTMGMLRSDYLDEKAKASNNNIRFMVVKNSVAGTPQEDVELKSSWQQIDSSSINQCSAVGYWYAKTLQQKLKVPVGLIVSAWGGTLIQPWIGVDGFNQFPKYVDHYNKNIKTIDFKQLDDLQKAANDKYNQTIINMYAETKQYISVDYDDHDWQKMKLPNHWEDAGYPTLDGIVYYRIAFTVRDADAGKAAQLYMPPIDDADSSYINGVLIGTNKQWDDPRLYSVPSGILKAGKNYLVIRVEDTGGGGGLASVEENFHIDIDQQKIFLAGDATYKIVAKMADISGGNGPIHQQATVLYNAMIAPFTSFGIRGALWYQGESNADNAKEYQGLFPAMIKHWRTHFKQDNFPFLFVQLSSFGALKDQPAASNWAELREAQTKTLSVPNTAMAVTTDIGDPLNIHPTKKKEVGERLAAQAFQMVYQLPKAVASGPQFEQYSISVNTITIQFKQAGKGLLCKGKKLAHFAIAGSDQQFVWADAEIKGNSVIVSSKAVAHPIAVRYAWADSPVDANLYNKEGYPAVPFRTDDW
ncbi:MAG: sialate O-acetylesterase [Ferruginibacter sp.]